MAEPFTIYKLTILNMLDKVDFPLTNTQISNFFLEQDYTDYFRVQQVISDLVDADLIRTESTHSNTQYTITAAGKRRWNFSKTRFPMRSNTTRWLFWKKTSFSFEMTIPFWQTIIKRQIRTTPCAVSTANIIQTSSI